MGFGLRFCVLEGGVALLGSGLLLIAGLLDLLSCSTCSLLVGDLDRLIETGKKFKINLLIKAKYELSLQT